MKIYEDINEMCVILDELGLETGKKKLMKLSKRVLDWLNSPYCPLTEE